MKTLQSFFVIALSLCATVTTHAQEKKFPVLKGPYLGQKPPGMKPEIFAQGIISMPTSKEYACTFSADGNEFYYTITRNKTQMIMCSKKETGVWSAPEPVKFSEGYFAHEPHVSHDNQRIYWAWAKPSSDGNYGTYFSERTRNGWSEARYAGKEWSISTTWDGKLYATDTEPSNGNSYLCEVIMKDGRFLENKRILDGIEKLRPKYDRVAHPCLAKDGSYIIFDVDGGYHLFISFKNENGKWGEPIDLSDKGFDKKDGIASLSPDGKYLFFQRNENIYWISAKIIEELRPKE